MATYCDVKQIYRDGTYLNVVDVSGIIGVWGSTYEKITILVLDGINFYFYQFEGQEYYAEWMEENKDKYNKILYLGYDKELKQSILEDIDPIDYWVAIDKHQ
jgi:hypothetical protein